ncbi:hypothetical protein [Sphingomonas sp. RB1R13]|uniref:hypothetical protein n=1 Tax=Sphingomonas sp. RB1R13 TaxID=3096159 RepID=UPI002FCB038F
MQSIAMLQSDVSYYRKRAVEERDLALQPDGEDAKTVHAELARRYQELVNDPEVGESRNTLTWAL